MSQDKVYPFNDQLHPEGLFAGAMLPALPQIAVALSVGKSNMVPIRIDEDDVLHLGIFAQTKTSPITDIVFRIEGDAAHVKEAREAIGEFVKSVGASLHDSDKHLCVREVHSRYTTTVFYIVRFYFNIDFDCTEHPEMRLGEETRPYLCPVCGAMQISGVPHIAGDNHD